MAMRIIAGTFRSRQLKPLKRLRIRPTSDMLRETLFNILGPRVEGARFLDLFAGTGAVGIEAVSRGAAHVVLVENDRAAARLISENLALLGISAEARLLPADAISAIAKIETERAAPFEFLFLDPPYANERDYHSVLCTLEASPLVSGDSMVIAEHRKTVALPAEIGRLRQFRSLQQGDAALSFYKLA
ncbi:MAG TPA: 16S rRNA (guanine(966)-N(2))-methyltransferase RsmD [Candidatus Acidoferrum sp.]|nr:16S rRNA (guanine(966)-N(2))-methyltransferase RsmD [Candidatus Acidoferrum sp.]